MAQHTILGCKDVRQVVHPVVAQLQLLAALSLSLQAETVVDQFEFLLGSLGS
jgi:hypothetical protein